ncbi:hypothetical protein [Gemmata obscuriglobus]|nr:hypothetical protein [Gemmata obscuriglobus]
MRVVRFKLGGGAGKKATGTKPWPAISNALGDNRPAVAPRPVTTSIR